MKSRTKDNLLYFGFYFSLYFLGTIVLIIVGEVLAGVLI